LHEGYKHESEETDASLSSEGGFGAYFVGPGDLEVGDDEAGGTTAEVEPGTDFSRSFRVTAEDVCLDTDSGDQDTEYE